MDECTHAPLVLIPGKNEGGKMAGTSGEVEASADSDLCFISLYPSSDLDLTQPPDPKRNRGSAYLHNFQSFQAAVQQPVIY